MKISFMLLFFSVINVYASNIAFSQEMKISVEMQNVTVRELIDEIEKKAGISFLYNDHLQELNKQVNAFYLDQPANFVLESVLSQAGLMFEEVGDNFIVLLPAKKDHAPVKPAHLLNSNNSSKLTVSLNSNSETSSNNRRLALTPLKSVASSNRQQQNFVVTGTVTSAEDDEPMPGVSVSVRGTTIGTVTDVEGSYSIEVPTEESVLRFSFVGMLRRDVIVGGQRIIDIELQPDVVGLDEVVVTGYGVQRRRDLTGSVSSVRSRDIEGMPVESVSRAIQGRLAGVQVTGSEGVPGANVSVLVRGVGSFASNDPIWIVDGVEVQTRQLSTMIQTGSESVMASLNFDDIESIDVLKDAAATAIYGARGANGVIIVTTKRGKASDVTDFTFEVRGGFSDPHRERDMMNGPQWAQWRLESIGNRYGIESSEYANRVQLGLDRNWYELGADGKPDFSTTPNYDWVDARNRTGRNWQARLTASGGDERTRFFTSFTHSFTEGHIISYDFTRSNLRLNLDHNATERLSFDMTVSANVADQTSAVWHSRLGSPLYGVLMIPPVEPIYDDEGNYFGAPASVWGANPAHPLNSAKYDEYSSKNIKFVANFGVSYNLTDNITYRGSFGLDYTDNAEKTWDDPRSYEGIAPNGRLRVYNRYDRALETTQTLLYQNVFADVHQLDGVVGFEAQERVFDTDFFRGAGFPHPDINVIGAASRIDFHGGTKTEHATMGTFGRINYTYDERYLLTLTGRYDGSSRFGAQNRWGFFPAAAIGWRISEETFMYGIEDIDNLMIRLSYGKSGSDAASAYAALGLWSGGINYDGRSGLYPTQLPNEFLTWEESRTLNLAVSMSAYGGRLNIDVDLYKRWAEELLLDRPLPYITGWTSITENVGQTLTEGIEISLHTVNIQTDNFQWTTNFNISYSENEILELLPGIDFLSERRMVGRAINDRYIPIWAGVNPADGRPMYYDEDMNITYNPSYDDRQWMGPEEPKSYGGITNNFRLGNFSTSVFFQYSLGNYKYHSEARFLAGQNADRNQFAKLWTKRWLEPGHVAEFAQPIDVNRYAGVVRTPNVYGSHMFQRADYVRLKEVDISYTLPRTIIQRFGMDNVRIFARGVNLFTWTDYEGSEPETTGTDFATYPTARTVTFGINTNF